MPECGRTHTHSTRTHARTHTHTHTPTERHTHTHTQTYMCTGTHTHTHIHTHIHMCTHTARRARLSFISPRSLGCCAGVGAICLLVLVLECQCRCRERMLYIGASEKRPDTRAPPAPANVISYLPSHPSFSQATMQAARPGVVAVLAVAALLLATGSAAAQPSEPAPSPGTT